MKMFDKKCFPLDTLRQHRLTNRQTDGRLENVNLQCNPMNFGESARVTNCACADTICLLPLQVPSWQYLRIYSPAGTCSGMLAI